MGKPQSPAYKEKITIMRKRNWKFNVYLNSDEKAMLVEKAEKTGLAQPCADCTVSGRSGSHDV